MRGWAGGGIDLHRRRSVIVRLIEAREKLETVRMDNDPVALGLEIAKAGPDPVGLQRSAQACGLRRWGTWLLDDRASCSCGCST
jgi:hypothetical protein